MNDTSEPMFVQRDVPLDEDLVAAGLWQPDLGPDFPADHSYITTRDGTSILDAQEGDSYVVVDERVDGTLRLAIDAWPRVDQDGRLHFGLRVDGKEEETVELVVEQTALHEQVSKHRDNHQRAAGPSIQLAPDRPIRIGDTFFVRGEAAAGLERWDDIVDVTRVAREAAKAALFGAVAPGAMAEAIEAQDEDALEDEDQDEPPPQIQAARPVL